jgi:hypothetical protein
MLKEKKAVVLPAFCRTILEALNRKTNSGKGG